MAHPRYEIVFHPAVDQPPTMLDSVADANAATVAFHAAVGLLLARRQVGEVHLIKANDDRWLLLRQPVRRIPEPIRPR